LALAACGPRQRAAPELSPPLPFPLTEPTLVADSVRTDTVAPGVLHRFYYIASGPWAIHVLDVDRAECWTVVASKGPPGRQARGRTRTSDILRYVSGVDGRLPNDQLYVTAVAAVNADFFALADGTPRGLFVDAGQVVTGPSTRPAIGADRLPWIGRFGLDGQLVVRGDTFVVSTWNRPAGRRGVAYFDSFWGERTDTLSGATELVLERRMGSSGYWRTLHITRVDTSEAAAEIAFGGGTLVVGPEADDRLRTAAATLRAGEDSVRLSLRLLPGSVLNAAAGFPILLHDGQPPAGLDSSGGTEFGSARHPRTAVGYDHYNRRLLLVTVDGRQPGYSAGMTLRELAETMRALGAGSALNLDGGGSTTMAVRAPADSMNVRVVNRPSDKEGERTVGNALLVARLDRQLGYRTMLRSSRPAGRSLGCSLD
ncbi:MAG TPA: phosphodiester glycosidase family protein, partial [Gemmatimonadaceae bacterium]|nr:phosphodiester glycosidase family protein [Gemmatimonadaceae bacterium]